MMFRTWSRLCLLGSLSLMPTLANAQPFEVTADQRAALGIVLSQPQKADNLERGPLPARVMAPNAGRRVLATPVPAVVSHLMVAPGTAVAKGDPVYRLGGADIVALQQQLLEAVRQSAIAGSVAEGDKQLLREGAIAERRWLKTQAEARAAEARVLAARSALTLLGVDTSETDALLERGAPAEYVTVVAPFTGVVMEQRAQPGQQLAAGDSVLELVDPAQLQLEIHAPVSLCEQATNSPTVAIAGLPVTARIVTVGCAIHAEDQGVVLRAAVDDPEAALKPGQLVDVTITLDVGDDAVWRVPRTGVTRHEGRQWVFVEQDGRFMASPVSVVAEEWNAWLLRVDIPDGSRLATEGALALKAIWTGAGGEE